MTEFLASPCRHVLNRSYFRKVEYYSWFRLAGAQKRPKDENHQRARRRNPMERQREQASTINTFGFWAGIIAAVSAITYSIPQLIIGIELPATPKDLFLILLPSFFIAPAFVALIGALHCSVSTQKRVLTLTAFGFAVAYFVFVEIVYWVSLTVVTPHIGTDQIEKFSLLRYTEKSLMTALESLGYSSMSIATGLAGFAVSGQGLRKWARRFLIANGILGPIILMAQVYPKLAYLGAPWLITFPGLAITLALAFKKNLFSKEQQK